MSDSKQLIVVLGAHRSGTSLCAAALASLGADACLHEVYANEENQKGFFEHPDIVQFNDDLLAHLGGSWDNPLFIAGAVESFDEPDIWIDRAAALLRDTYAGVPLALVKDPRMCQLLGFWQLAFSRAGYASGQVHYVHTLRSPVEVALSQRNRTLANTTFYEFGATLAEGAALWLSLTAQSLSDDSVVGASCFVSYANLLQQPGNTVRKLARSLQLPEDAASIDHFSSRFVDSTLYRAAENADARAELQQDFPQVLEFDEALQPLLQGRASPGAVEAALAVYHREDTRERLLQVASPAFSRLSNRCRNDRLALAHSQDVAGDLRNQLTEMGENIAQMRAEHQSVLKPLRDENSKLQSGNSALQQQLREQSAETDKATDALRKAVGEVGQLQGRNLQLADEKEYLEEQKAELLQQIQAMEQSTSWRLTRPLRSLGFRLQRLKSWSASRWVQFRLKAILVYHRMSLRRPGVAWTIRRVLRPLFRGLNRVFGTGPRDMHVPADSGLLTPMLYQQREASGGFAPLVSVIVPNYNHAAYLPLRLESIFSQTYRNFEVILLDDASSDDSAAVLRDFHQRHPEQSTLVINEQNSGGVFHQWEKGLNLARGEIVWIAESDDWCTENFLETLVPFFENEAIMLAYARTVFMDGDGERQIWSINEYLHDIDPQRWNHPLVETGAAIVRDAFAVKNIVPNVSSALFRTPRNLEILADPQWRKMRTCGDWVLYLHLLRGGMLAYSPEACNYYRIHGENTSVGSYSQDEFYREHEVVALTVRRFYDVPATVFERLRDNLAVHWRETRGDYSEEALAECFSIERIEAVTAARSPNLLMASYAFCSGGGETFPVSLANIMKAHGYNVTYLDCDREPRLDGVRNRLRGDIPIVSDFTQLERIVDDFDIDIIHSHHAWMDSTILDILPEDMGVKTVVTLHGMYETINEYDLRAILPRLVRRSACLIYVAEKNLQAIEAHGLLEHARLQCIDNALEIEPFEPVSRDSLGVPADAFVLTLVSRAMEEKGWSEAIEAVGLAREKAERDIHLLLVGDGPEYDRLQGKNLPAYVHLEGFQRNVRGYFAAADIGFLPSRFRGESFPLVIIECLQSGVPFLATDLGEIARMLQGKDGMAGAVLSLDGDNIDVSTMADLIATIADDADRYQSMREAVAAATEKFDPAVLASKHDAAYRAALDVVA